MAVELAVIGALVSISALLGYFAFQFRESQEEFWQKVSIALFFMSLVFLNLVMNATLLIVQNNAMTYLEDSVIVWGLWIMNWITVLLVIFFIGWVFWTLLYFGFEKLSGKTQHRAEYGRK